MTPFAKQICDGMNAGLAAGIHQFQITQDDERAELERRIAETAALLSTLRRRRAELARFQTPPRQVEALNRLLAADFARVAREISEAWSCECGCIVAAEMPRCPGCGARPRKATRRALKALKARRITEHRRQVAARDASHARRLQADATEPGPDYLE